MLISVLLLHSSGQKWRGWLLESRVKEAANSLSHRVIATGSLSREVLPFPTAPCGGTFARGERGTSSTGVSSASLRKSLFVLWVFFLRALKTQQRQGETEHICKDMESANGSHWPHSLQGFILCWTWSALASPSHILCHTAGDSLFISLFPSFFSYGCECKGMLSAAPACSFFPTLIPHQGKAGTRGWLHLLFPHVHSLPPARVPGV